MRLSNLTLTLLLFCFSAQSWGAWEFDGTNDYVSMADNDALTLPDADWTVAGWVKLTSNVGSAFHVLFDNWDDANSWFELLIGEDSNSAFPQDIRSDTQDDDGSTPLQPTSTNNPFASNTSWTHVIARRSGTTINIYIGASSVASIAVGSYDAVNGITWLWGVYSDGTGLPDTNYLNGALAEWAKWDRALTTAEMSGLAAGFSPNCYPGFQWFSSMVRDYNELAKGIAVTNNGSTVVAHPRIIYCGG